MLIVAFLATALLLVAVIAHGKIVSADAARQGRRRFRVMFPAEVDERHIANFLRSFSGIRRRARLFAAPRAMVWEVAGTSDGVTYHIEIDGDSADLIVQQLRLSVRNLHVEEVERRTALGLTTATEYRLSNNTAPLRAAHHEAIARSALAGLRSARGSEAVVVQWVLSPGRPVAPSPPVASPTEALLPRARAREAQRDREHMRLAAAKLGDTTLQAAVRIGAKAGHPARAGQLVAQASGFLRMVAAPGVSFRPQRLTANEAVRRLEDGRVPLAAFPVLLNVNEATGLLAPPLGPDHIDGMERARGRKLPPPPDLPTKGRVIGVTSYPGVERPVATTLEGAMRAVHILGPIGSGKSVTLASMAVADFSERRKPAVILFDPKKDTFESVADRVPAGRLPEVTLVDPSDLDFPIAFNLLARSASPELLTDQVVAVFKRWFGDLGPRSADILYAAVLSLAMHRGMSLLEVPRLLGDAGFRRKVVGQIDDPVHLGPFWAAYEAWSPGEQASYTAPLMNKLRVLYRPNLRNIVGQSTNALDFDRVIARGEIVLVTLAPGLLGEEGARLLGSLLISELWAAIRRRAGVAAEKRRPVTIYVDEFQDLVALPTSLDAALAQSRGLGAGWHLAHQNLAQLPLSMREAVLSNTRTKVCFAPAADDAHRMARELRIDAADLQGLGAYEAVVAIEHGGQTLPAITARMSNMPPATGSAEAARTQSRERWSKPRAEVEAEIRSRYEAESAKPNFGRSRRVS